jgi:hypothetical protein
MGTLVPLLDCLARRGCNAQFPYLSGSDHSVVIAHRTCSVSQEAVHLTQDAAYSPAKSQPSNRSTGPLPHLEKFSRASVTRGTWTKIQPWRTAHRASGQLFQSRFTFFQQSEKAKTRTGRVLRRFLRNATRKMRTRSPHLLCCALLPLCLVSGTLSRNRQCSFRLFNDNLS